MSAQRVLDLLDYIEQVEKLKTRPAYTLPTDFFVAHQRELTGLPELRFNLQSEGDDVWLRLPRLQEVPAPEPDDRLKPWISPPRNPERPPELKAEAVFHEGKQEIDRQALKDHPDIRELFDGYLQCRWQPWAVAEAPRRRAIHRYNQLFALQQAIASEGAETPLELVWGIGYAVWKKEGLATPVRHPLLVQACEVTLNEKSFDLEVRPRDSEPRLEADCYAEMGLTGVRPLEAFWKGTLDSGAHRLNPFEPATWEATLKVAVGHLDPGGTYEPGRDDAPLPLPGPALRVTGQWVLFGRRRSGDVFIEDVRRLRKSVAAAPELPRVIRSLVEHGDDTVRLRPEIPFRGLSSSDSPEGARELYFPMPYNDEQVSIVQKLESNDGVVVQGPPGTGKTHTIANVVCHYLAQGKRVLVTAKSESALAVVQEKLPERIRPLCVSLLSDERDGMKQFEHAIQTIATRVAALNPLQAGRAIAAAEEGLDQLHAKIAHVDATVAGYAQRHMKTYALQGRQVTPEEMARVVAEQAEEHQWFDDEPPPSESLPFDDDAIAALREARRRVGSDLAGLGRTLPAVEAFPPWVEMQALHRDLARAKAIDAEVQRGAVFALADLRPQTFERARALDEFLAERRQLLATLESQQLPWVDALRQRLRGMKPQDPLLQALLDLCGELGRLEQARSNLVAQAAEVPVDAELNDDFVEAATRQAQGRGAFALFFGKAEARALVAAVQVAGVAATRPEDWRLVLAVVKWRLQARKALARWSSMAGEFGLEAPGPGVEPALRGVAPWQTAIEAAHRLTFEFDQALPERVAEVLGKAVADRLAVEPETTVAAVTSSLQAHIGKERLGYAQHRVQEIAAGLDGHAGAIVDAMRDFLGEALGRPSADEGVLQTTWIALLAELARLRDLAPDLERIRDLALEIENAGAPKWAERIRTVPATGGPDPVLPEKWRRAWKWRLAVDFLDRIDGHHKLRGLFEERRLLTASLARMVQNLVADKTWLGVFNNSPDSVRQALQAYLNAVQAMGAGTGVRAVRHRKIARDAMARAYKAVPCWVLPQWRVSETLPPEIGLFDLVIVDEASQSDIWALPALLRGRKLLVVGDHKQVSPSAVGTAEERIRELVNRFLAQQPHGSEMTPDKSIYDLARVVFAGNSVMLKEHFRSVPAIIEFSNREFYENEIRPLRLPRATERLDPPLVDVYVKGGHRKGDVNLPEAKAVVDEIEAILADRVLAGRSIGVVTLLGTEQAACIHRLVSERISPVDVVARRLVVGPPPVFQGSERDIMLVSMVLGPGDRAAAHRADMHQRFNVALSRARDRMILFRSVGDREFDEDTLNGRVIAHFRQPFQRETQQVETLRDRCLSAFEREVFDELVGLGFRVQPQVPSGGFFIDFVVEGHEGRRLAIECDGDRFHGPGQWQDDMARQRVLERAGWTFWRCFASTFLRRREEVMADLLQTLRGLGIEPVGAATMDNTVWVRHKVVDPYAVDIELSPETA